MGLDERLMKTYYRTLFPLDLIFKCLRIDENREISFGLGSGGYIRFLTFKTAEEFRKKLLGIVPERIDVGAIYKDRPVKHNVPKVAGKELVFDVDLTDYPRECCTEKLVCNKCLVLIKVAVRILDYSLRKEFGFKNVGFVFSGRRGMHCWVFDEAALELNDIERGEIVRYYDTVVKKKVYSKEYEEILREYSFFLGDETFKESELFEKMYIRIDKEVTQKSKHLIKMPFSVHPSTEIISVPIDPSSLDSVKLEDFPRLGDVLESPERLQPYLGIAEKWRGLS
ncbi:DNA primase small subunit [Encephalitozoon intestinalis ATCC 50506]|uniref:DNA primase small subunit n=1 Tax=Encephalitozoon intestinalis (strain ATCC 50506) TaxID=876142 RepID=E0S8J8_ENCIT|nr:DNA primase small subunit [Encephalitozoon intestinalis ATCC 50506]ADM11992.1 DNA primase small subunit [Encephalitozoon intestinalis ATCC 50506]UTX45779.1 DNA primase small subunit [Encephalitozoon intestinalis]